MKFTLTIDSASDQAQTDSDRLVTSALENIIDKITSRPWQNQGAILDVNGNRVGSWAYDCQTDGYIHS